jgi:hypothetical protein
MDGGRGTGVDGGAPSPARPDNRPGRRWWPGAAEGERLVVKKQATRPFADDRRGAAFR